MTTQSSKSYNYVKKYGDHNGDFMKQLLLAILWSAKGTDCEQIRFAVIPRQ